MAQCPIYGDKKPGPNCTGNYIVNRPDLKSNSSELSVFYQCCPSCGRHNQNVCARKRSSPASSRLARDRITSDKPNKWALIGRFTQNRDCSRSEEHTSELQSRLHLVC